MLGLGLVWCDATVLTTSGFVGGYIATRLINPIIDEFATTAVRTRLKLRFSRGG